MPIVPTVPDCVLSHIKVKDLTSSDVVSLQKSAALFILTMNKKVHTMADRRLTTKLVWIDVCNRAFRSHATEPGPLAAHKTFDGKEGQNKLKKIILKAEAYYAKQATARETGDDLLRLISTSAPFQEWVVS